MIMEKSREILKQQGKREDPQVSASKVNLVVPIVAETQSEVEEISTCQTALK